MCMFMKLFKKKNCIKKYSFFFPIFLLKKIKLNYYILNNFIHVFFILLGDLFNFL